jgi:hypothetical protein
MSKFGIEAGSGAGSGSVFERRGREGCAEYAEKKIQKIKPKRKRKNISAIGNTCFQFRSINLSFYLFILFLFFGILLRSLRNLCALCVQKILKTFKHH